MDAQTAIRGMLAASGKSGRQVSREIGRNESFLSASFAQGVCPRVDTFSHIAEACGYVLVAVPKDSLITSESEEKIFTIEYREE